MVGQVFEGDSKGFQTGVAIDGPANRKSKPGADDGTSSSEWVEKDVFGRWPAGRDEEASDLGRQRSLGLASCVAPAR